MVVNLGDLIRILMNRGGGIGLGSHHLRTLWSASQKEALFSFRKVNHVSSRFSNMAFYGQVLVSVGSKLPRIKWTHRGHRSIYSVRNPRTSDSFEFLATRVRNRGAKVPVSRSHNSSAARRARVCVCVWLVMLTIPPVLVRTLAYVEPRGLWLNLSN